MPLSADEGQRSCHDLFKTCQQLETFLAGVFTHLRDKEIQKFVLRWFFSTDGVIYISFPRHLGLHALQGPPHVNGTLWCSKSQVTAPGSVFRLTLAGTRLAHPCPAEGKYRIPSGILVKP